MWFVAQLGEVKLMISYRIRRIGWDVVEGPAELAFPAQCELQVEFAPPDVFGNGPGPSPIVTDGGNLTVILNRMTGALSFKSDGRLPPVSAHARTDLGELRFKGHKAVLCFEATGPEDIWIRCNVIDVCLVPLLTLEFTIPVLLDSIRGSLGPSSFELRADQPSHPMVVTSRDTQERKIGAAVNLADEVRDDAQPRIIAALNYIHNAYRLRFAGTHPHEFLSEIILNAAKSLDALLTPSHDRWRAECRAIGFGEDEIEQRIVPIGLIRNALGVAHCVLSTPDRDNQRAIEAFAGSSLEWAAKVLRRVLEHTSTGYYQLPNYEQRPWEEAHGDLVAALRSYANGH